MNLRRNHKLIDFSPWLIRLKGIPKRNTRKINKQIPGGINVAKSGRIPRRNPGRNPRKIPVAMPDGISGIIHEKTWKEFRDESPKES